MKFCMLSLVLPQSASVVVLFLYTYAEKKSALDFLWQSNYNKILSSINCHNFDNLMELTPGLSQPKI